MDKKYCAGCDREKDLTEFNLKNKRTGLRHFRCRACMNKYCREHYANNPEPYKARSRKANPAQRINVKRRVLTYLSTHPCVDCGESNPLCLDFDHVKEGKTDTIARMTHRGRKWQRIEAEMALCEVRCANCHRKKSAKQFGYHPWAEPLQQPCQCSPMV